MEEGRDGCQDARLGCGSEVVPFVRQHVRLVGDVETLEEGLQVFRMVKADDRICLAVEDQSRGKGRGGALRIRTDQAAGDFHDAARDNGMRRGGLGSQSQRKEGAQRYAYERDAVRIDRWAAAKMCERVADSVDPERDVDTVGQGRQVGADGAGAVEVMDGIDGDAEAGDKRGDSIEPEVRVAPGTMEKKDGRVGSGGKGFDCIEADGAASAQEGSLHGDGMQERRGMIADEMVDGVDNKTMVERLAAGDVRALSRAVSMVEDGARGAEELLRACQALGKRSRRIGVTGSPGAGKSTLVDGMVRLLRAQGETVGVVAVDPSSPYTGGALLGDRIRMQGFTGDAGVYIRSMASRGALGGVARKAEAVCAVMEAAGRGTVIIETVGVGQDEVGVAGLADVTVLMLVPGMGDDVQSLKAGVMEVADIFVVNKSDQPGADKVEREIAGMQGLAAGGMGVHTGWVPPIVRTVANTGEGIPKLLETIDSFLSQRDENASRWQPEVSKMEIDHLGIAVRSIEFAKTFYELLGLRVTHEEMVEHEGVKTAMLPVGASRFELLEPLGEETTIGRFLAKRGEGLHHVAVKVSGIDERFKAMQAAGVRLASDQVRVGAGGHRYFFVHPASTGGVLLELVEGQ